MSAKISHIFYHSHDGAITTIATITTIAAITTVATAIAIPRATAAATSISKKMKS